MAKPKSKEGSVSTLRVKIKVKRKGIHSKKKASHLKGSKNYKKQYRGQGR